MKTFIYFLSVLAVVLCTSTGLLSQEREIGVIQNGKPTITNNTNAGLYFKAIYGAATDVQGLNIQWSKEKNKFFLVGRTSDGIQKGLALTTSANKLTAAPGPAEEIVCVGADCDTCVLDDCVCICDSMGSTGACAISSRINFLKW